MAMHCMKLFEMSGLSKLNPQPLPLSIVLCLLCVPLTLSILSFMLYFLPILCLHNVVLCLLCVPLATSVYSILSFMLYFLPFLCLHCIYSFTVFTLCTHSCITRAYQYQSKKKIYSGGTSYGAGGPVMARRNWSPGPNLAADQLLRDRTS